jgi:uncharacterized protein YunC (DUF1805 family)
MLHLLDSAANITADMRNAIVVTGSHGGLSAAKFALPFAPRLVVFNDAGGGLDDAGWCGLAWLKANGIAACTVAHTSARIGEAQSTFDTGVISRVNALASALGVRVGQTCREAVDHVSA